jgi:hypothetical protein
MGQVDIAVYCRAKWDDGNKSAPGELDNEEGYLNLAKIAGVSRVRGATVLLLSLTLDTSTYHYSPYGSSSHYRFPKAQRRYY